MQGLVPNPLPNGPLQAVAWDGKVLCGTLDQHQRSIHLPALFDQQTGGVLQLAVPHDTHEHEAARTLLKEIALRGRVITGDAIFCQRDLCQQLTEHRTVDKGHGRLTKRHLQASSRLAGHLEWPGLAQVCRIERAVQEKGCETTEIAYAITSLTAERASAAELLACNRGHWGLENRLHGVRDVSLGEDACRANVPNCPQNLAAWRNVGLTRLRAAGVSEILSTLRDFATRPDGLLRFLRILKQ